MRLRGLRLSCPSGRLTGQQLAQRLGWAGSKVSKLENGKQTATPEDLRAWANATEQPGAYAELAARLAGFESHIRSWRRALANGFKPLHEGLSAEIDRTSDIWVWEESVVAGLLQTPEYTRHVIQRYSNLLGEPPTSRTPCAHGFSGRSGCTGLVTPCTCCCGRPRCDR